MVTTHRLKSWPEFFEAVISGLKPFEVRINDRGFQQDDILVLEEWNPETEKYTGRMATVRVTYVLDAGPGIIRRGLQDGYVVMGITAASFAVRTLPVELRPVA